MKNDLNPSLSPADEAIIRHRQQSRARIMAILLGVFVVLVFGISIVKMQLALG